MHEELKLRMGIDTANCLSCESLGSDGDGYEYNGTWPVCDCHPNLSNLKSFPFKKEMKCWAPNFWESKFADLVKTGSDEEMNNLGKQFKEALKR